MGSVHHLGVLWLRLERQGCEVRRATAGEELLAVTGPAGAVDAVVKAWDAEGRVEVVA